MRCFAVVFRHITLLRLNKRIGNVVVALLLLNSVLLMIFRNVRESVFCYSTKENEGPSGQFSSNYVHRQSYSLNLTAEFIWIDEVSSLVKAIPVVDSTGNRSLDSNNSIPEYEPLNIFEIEKYSIAHEIVNLKSILLPKYDKNLSGVDIENGLKKAFLQGLILNCEKLSHLETKTSDNLPKISYNHKDFNQKKGILYLDMDEAYDIVTVKFKIDKQNEKDPTTKHIMNRLFKLITMQGWEGLPNLYSVCVSDSKRNDVMLENGVPNLPIQISYVIDRFDDVTPICSKHDCVKENQLIQYISRQSKPAISALNMIISISKIFEMFSQNGIFSLNLFMNEMAIGKSGRFVITNVDPFIFLDKQSQKINNSSYKRLLSDLSCKLGYKCPMEQYKDNNILHAYGQYCKEVVGYCSSSNKCWGMDAVTYLCCLSKWVFRPLSLFVPLSVREQSNLTTWLKLAEQSSPEKRCNWTKFRKGIENVLQFILLQKD